MPNETQIITARLEEYRALRAEIVALMTRQGQHMNLAWTGAIALVTVASLTKLPEVAALSVLFIAASWYDYLGMSAAIVRLGEYIATCIEPNVPGLFWETSARQIYTTTVSKRSWFYRFWVACVSSYGVFGIIALAISVGLLVANQTTDRVRMVFSISVVSVAAVRFLQVAISAAGHPKKRGSVAEWLKNHSIDGGKSKILSDG
jgi:hypothetical protein